MTFAIDSWASTKVALLVLLHHLGKTACSDDVASVDHSVEVASRLLDLFAHFIVAVEVEDVCDEVECVLIVVDFGV